MRRSPPKKFLIQGKSWRHRRDFDAHCEEKLRQHRESMAMRFEDREFLEEATRHHESKRMAVEDFAHERWLESLIE